MHSIKNRMDHIKYLLHQSIHRPVRQSEMVPVSVSPTGNHLQKNMIVMDVEIIHCKAEQWPGQSSQADISDSLNECVHPEQVCPALFLRPKLVPIPCRSFDWH
jgi:hypothetical protein